ncbi:MAG: hypothetical protein OJF49_002511 [Ktedonobacterales bacterium]|jgi:hypothetical protein|nr:MAG: hypothetical protein OJF49_002511 [Ktedonobacterales bacterium]
MNSHTPPTPTPQCAAFDALLPLLNTDALSAGEAAATREHVAGCAWCRAQLDAYEALEAATRRHYGPDAGLDARRLKAVPRFTLEDIMSASEREETGSETTASASADVPLSPLRRAPGRLTALGAVAAVLLITLLTGLIYIRGGALRTGGTPAPTPGHGGNQIAFVQTVPWGTLTVNGHAVATPGDLGKPITLPLGRATLTYTAAPFEPLTCTISVPAASSDTCPLQAITKTITTYPDSRPSVEWPPYADGVRVIALGAAPNLLPKAQFDALVAATQSKLDALASTAEVEPGDHYLGSDGKAHVATAPFPATLTFQTPSESMNVHSTIVEVCKPFCTPINFIAHNGPSIPWDAGSGWQLVFLPTAQWQYTPPGSQEVVVHEHPDFANQNDLAVNWVHGSWQVTLVPGKVVPQTLCLTVQVYLMNASLQEGFDCRAVASPPAEGFVVKLSESGGLGFYHFGVLVAVNGEAHKLYPALPLASAHEAALAHQLAGS